MPAKRVKILWKSFKEQKGDGIKGNYEAKKNLVLGRCYNGSEKEYGTLKDLVKER